MKNTSRNKTPKVKCPVTILKWDGAYPLSRWEAASVADAGQGLSFLPGHTISPSVPSAGMWDPTADWAVGESFQPSELSQGELVAAIVISPGVANGVCRPPWEGGWEWGAPHAGRTAVRRR
ncbi:hypothetical protein E2C01_030199 [Portunus trituberculatus]|uniref:Uncharacterized protein n=1 Tax=Portunus trituberculatus TaxID=210409 RepID=A0A5B7EQA0_PORTR|nr:hypothetical protein [Portunus trituberculatus]